MSELFGVHLTEARRWSMSQYSPKKNWHFYMSSFLSTLIWCVVPSICPLLGSPLLQTSWARCSPPTPHPPPRPWSEQSGNYAQGPSFRLVALWLEIQEICSKTPHFFPDTKVQWIFLSLSLFIRLFVLWYKYLTNFDLSGHKSLLSFCRLVDPDPVGSKIIFLLLAGSVIKFRIQIRIWMLVKFCF